jgi:hypothetical protein
MIVAGLPGFLNGATPGDQTGGGEP